MVDGVTHKRWAELRALRPQNDDALTVLPVFLDGVETQINSAMDSAGHLHLLISVGGGPESPLQADLNGLRVRYRRLESGDVLDLSAPPSHEQVFTPFCNEVIEAVVRQSREPWKAVAAISRAWQSAWKVARQGMEKTLQVGLFGELFVLRNLMIPTLGCDAIYCWSGPESERHDFISGLLHIEVKTTRKSRAEHEISRLDQLRIPNGRRLLLVSVQLEESIGGCETLATQVDATIELLRSDLAALDTFMTKLTSLGWSEEVRSSGELLHFNLRGAEVFAVDDEFPRLPDDFCPPLGVVAVKYTIDLANLPSLGMDEVGEIISATKVTKAY